MEIINRDQKIEFLHATEPTAQAYYLSQDLALSDSIFSENETAAQHYESMQKSRNIHDDKLLDFGMWLRNSPEAKDLIATGAYAFELLPVYGEAIEHEQKKLEAWLPELNAGFGESLKILAEEGHIPVVLAERFQQSPQACFVSVSICDSFIRNKYLGSARMPAFYLPDYHTAGFRPFSPETKLARYFVHEGFHGLAGTSMRKNGDELYWARSGLSARSLGENSEATSKKAHRAINEGVTEYLTNLVFYGLPGQISAENREGNDTGKYKAEREIVQILANRIGLGTILNAYAEDYNPDQPDLLHMRAFVRDVSKAYGLGFLQKVDKLDQHEGVERALTYVKAADYLIGTQIQKLSRVRLDRILTLVGLR